MSDSQRPSALAVLSALTPVAVAGIGAWFTHIYKTQEVEANRIAADKLQLERQQRLLIDKASVVKQYFEYLANKADDNQQKAALAVLASLGYTDLVIKVVTTDPTPSNVQALIAIAATGDKDETNSAVGALESLARTSAQADVSAAAERGLTRTQAGADSASAATAAIVAGADRTLQAAQFEVKRLNDAGFSNAQIIRKGGWYRTVVPVDARQEQQAALNSVQSTIRRSAYAVDLSKWCDNAPDGGECATINTE